MKLLLLTPIFERFKKSAFFSSLSQNTCPVYDSEEIKKQEQQETIRKLYPQKKSTRQFKLSIKKKTRNENIFNVDY